MADDRVSATTVINAPAEAIFAVLTDPAKHAALLLTLAVPSAHAPYEWAVTAITCR